jgi:hypothetical protein
MVRTTVMADPELMDELRSIAKEEGISLGEVMRQGLEWRARTRRPPSFLRRRNATAQPTDDAASKDEEIIIEWVAKKHDGRRLDAGL